ncbi:transposase [Streptomyces sp. SCSIO 30461]
MSTTMDHRIETSGSVSLAVADSSVQGADVKSMPVSQNGLSSELLEELAALAAEKVRGEGLRLMGEGGLLPELAQHLMQAALEAEMDEHLATEAGRSGGRGSRSGGNMRNGYRTKKVMTEVGAVTVQIPRDRLGTFRPRMLPVYARRTGALDDLVISLTAKGLTSGEIVSHLAQTYGMTTTKETISTITDRPWSRWRSGAPARSIRSSSSTPSTSRSGMVTSPTGRSTWPLRSPPTATARSSACGPGTAGRAPSTGRPS